MKCWGNNCSTRKKIAMPMYNLMVHSQNYSLTSETLCDKVNGNAYENNASNFRINNGKIAKSESFEYKTELIKRTSNIDYRLDTEVAVLLTLFRMSLSRAAHGWGEQSPLPALPKICHTWPKEDTKCIWSTWYTLLFML